MTHKATPYQQQNTRPGTSQKDDSPGYPSSPAGEDIYHHFREEKDINPEDISAIKQPNEPDEDNTGQETGLMNVSLGMNMDIPGSELDDDQEKIGNEDEENNFYSLGGDGHTSLDEDQQ
jgi:hypothetical protein